jgi:ADP-dependent NAD(P)H-hydrate dehydratase / NAD(P)H-hydrate epimerase
MLPLLTASQFKDWEEYTRVHDGVTELDLVGRAAASFATELLKHYPNPSCFDIFCGSGNNGADGLEIGRILLGKGFAVKIYTSKRALPSTAYLSKEAELLHFYPYTITNLTNTNAEVLPKFQQSEVIIDALFGIGLNRSITGIDASVIDHINKSEASVVAVDIPSGMNTDGNNFSDVVVKADLTITFETPKFALLLPQNQEYSGKFRIVNIDLNRKFLERLTCSHYFLTEADAVQILKQKPRGKFAHKGLFGKALLIVGSKGKYGAALLSTQACLRSGVGKLTVHLPEAAGNIINNACPEALTELDPDNNCLSVIGEQLDYSAIGIGPGLGLDTKTRVAFNNLLDRYHEPIIIDADALNLLAADHDLFKKIPVNSLLTPHFKEFARLTKETNDDFERLQLLQDLAREYQVITILKGAHTVIATPKGELYFNSSGNPGMAKAGTGDCLTGLLTGLLAQGFSPLQTALLGVFWHGLAGDLAAFDHTETCMLASDLNANLEEAAARLLS